MNIKKSPLVAGLLTLNAIFGAMTGKAEASSYSITEEDRQAIFNQKEMAAVPVADGNATISVRTGWSAETDVATNYVKTVEGGVTSITEVVTSTIWTAPFVVHNADRSSGFTKAFSNAPEWGNIGTVAVNEDDGRMYAFANGMKNEFYEFSFGNVTATEPLKILTQLTPSVTTLEFHSNSNPDSSRQETTVQKAVAWTDKDEGEFLLTYRVKQGDVPETIIWHRNGVVNRRADFAGIEPVDVLKGENVIYYGNVTNNQLVSISKANPEAGETAVSLLSNNVGVGVVGDTLYQAKSDGIYDKNGQALTMEKKIVYEGDTLFWPLDAIDIKHMTMSYDKTKLIIACDATEEKSVKDYRLSDKTSVIAVKGASKVEARKDGIYALIQNQMQKVR